MAQRRYYIYVAIFRGRPRDRQRNRHVALWFVPEKGGKSFVFHAVGRTRAFSFESKENYDPTTSNSFAKIVTVATTAHKFTADELLQWLQRVPIDNNDPEYTCVSWVDEALKMLRDAGSITSDDYERAMDDTIGATLEATEI